MPKKTEKTLTVALSIFCSSADNINLCPVADAEGFHCCQCSTSKWLTFISRVEFSFLKINKVLNLPKSSCGRRCIIWHRLEDTIFLVVPFLAQFAIPCNVLSVLASSFPATNIQIF